MIREKWNQIVQNQEVRQNLSQLRKEIKDDSKLKQLLWILSEEEQVLIGLLDSEDAKTRKNAALLMGDTGKQEFLQPVYEAYQREAQRFVKSSYLSAIGKFDYRQYLNQLKERLETLNKEEVTTENQKHLMEEMRELSSLIVRMEGIAPHKFIGWNDSYNIVLLTNRNFADITRDELMELEPTAQAKVFGAGVLAQVEHLNWTRELRTYHELLFTIDGMKACTLDPFQCADMIVKSKLMEFLTNSHDGGAPFYFRVEYKSKRSLDEKSAFVKRLSGQIEKLSNRELINTTDNYEIELRVIENKEGNCNILVKLYTIKDGRFTYREDVTPTSIRPVNAALTVALAKEYMKEDAQVLDPFCGVGTMLIERHKAVRANTTYGIDIQEDAILKARKNTDIAQQVIHYINRDCFDFQHDYLFDEVITDMPFQIGRFTEDEVYEIYENFFNTIYKHLKEDAVLILYSHNKDFVRQLAPEHDFKIIKEYEISRKEGTYVFILMEI